MTDPKPNQEQLTENAALLALGLLNGEEAKRLEAELAADPSLAEVLALDRDAAALLAESLTPVSPPASLRDRVLGIPSKGTGALLASDGKWKQSPGQPGIHYKKLFFDEDTGLVTVLVRMDPGASINSHTHTKTEQCLVLEGEILHEGHIYGPGDFTWARAGSVDPELRADRGALLLLIKEP